MIFFERPFFWLQDTKFQAMMLIKLAEKIARTKTLNAWTYNFFNFPQFSFRMQPCFSCFDIITCNMQYCTVYPVRIKNHVSRRINAHAPQEHDVVQFPIFMLFVRIACYCFSKVQVMVYTTSWLKKSEIIGSVLENSPCFFWMKQFT